MRFQRILFVIAAITCSLVAASETWAADDSDNQRGRTVSARYNSDYSNRYFDGSYNHRRPGRFYWNWNSGYYDPYRRGFYPYNYSYGYPYGSYYYGNPYSSYYYNYYNPYIGGWSNWDRSWRR
jgi:hypothetical protein